MSLKSALLRSKNIFRSRNCVTLIVGDAGYRLIKFEDRRIADIQEWTRNDEARSFIMRELASLKNHRLVILVDSVEQTYRREEMPVANPLDRHRMIERRLEIAFPAAGLRRAIHLSTEKDDTHSKQNYLFAALPNSDELQNWIKDLEALDRPVDGIGLLPLEVAAHNSRLRQLIPTSSPDLSGSAQASAHDPQSWFLVLGQEQTGGIRQIVLHNNTLTLTRLAATPPSNLPEEMLAAQFQRDIKSTLDYLTRLGYQSGTPLTMLVFANDNLRKQIFSLPSLGSGISVVVRTPVEALNDLGVDTQGLDSNTPWADPVFAALIAEDGLKLPLTTSTMIRKKRIWNTAKTGQSIAASVFLTFLAANGYAITEKLAEDQHIDNLRDGKRTTNITLEQRKSELDTQNVKIEELSKISRAHDYLGPPQFDYLSILDSVSASMTPETRFSHFSWQRIQEKANNRRRNKNEEALPRPEVPRVFNLRLNLDLGRLSSLEEAILTTKTVASDLNTYFPEYKATITRHAVDILPGQALLGDIEARSLEKVTGSGMNAEISIDRTEQ